MKCEWFTYLTIPNLMSSQAELEVLMGSFTGVFGQIKDAVSGATTQTVTTGNHINV